MKIEIPDDIYQRCADYLVRNAGHIGTTSVEHFIASTLEIATWENPAFTNPAIAEVLQKDPLTQCYNRKKFDYDLASAIRQAQSQGEFFLACKFCGIDVLKLRDVNDRSGPRAGDQLLIDVANHVMEYFKPSPVYRMGGEQFVAWLDHEDRRSTPIFSIMHPVKVALIDLTIVLEGGNIDEACYQVRERIRAGISEGAEQGVFVGA